MVRTTVTLATEDRNWLDRYSRRMRLPAAATARHAIRRYWEDVETGGLRQITAETAGAWQGGHRDGQREVDRMRREWEARGLADPAV